MLIDYHWINIPVGQNNNVYIYINVDKIKLNTSTFQSFNLLSCPQVNMLKSSGDQDKNETQSVCSFRIWTTSKV